MRFHRTRPMPFVVSLMVTGLVLPSGPAAQVGQSPERERSVEDIARSAPDWNLSVRQAMQTLSATEDGFDATPGWDSSSLSLSGEYESGSDNSRQFGTSLRSEPYPQLAFQAGIDTTLTETGHIQSREFASVDVRPLVPSRTTWEQSRDYQEAIIRLRDARDSTFRRAEAAALGILIRQQEATLAEQTLQLREREFEVETRRRELGEASFQDVQDRQVALILARQESFRAQQQILQSETNLARLIPLADHPIRVQPLSRAELRDMVNQRLAEVNEQHQSMAATTELLLAEVELAAQEAQLRTTTTWRPDLTLSAGISLPPDGRQPVAQGGVQLRVSPSQDTRDSQRRRRNAIELQRLEVASQRSTAELERQLALQSLALEQEALEAAESQLQRDQTSEDEAQMLIEQGSRTQLQLEQIRLNRRGSEIDAFQAAVDLYLTAGSYLDLVTGSGAR